MSTARWFVIVLLAFQAGCVTRSDWAAPRPFELHLTRDRDLEGDAIVVDILGVTGESSLGKIKAAVADGSYFQSENSVRREVLDSSSRRYGKMGVTRSFESGNGAAQPMPIEREDPIWKAWKDNQVRYIVVVTNMRVRGTSKDPAESRIKVVDHNKHKLPAAIKRDKMLTFNLTPNGIVCIPPID